MTNRLVRVLGAIFACLALHSPLWAQENAPPQNYMMEKHSVTEPFYCDLADSIEEIACMAWDAALGVVTYYSQAKSFDRDQFNILVALSAMNIIQQQVSGPRSMVYYDKGFGGCKQDDCLIQQRGSCGNHQFIFNTVMSYVDINSRSVGVYMELDGKRLSHAMNEIKIEDRWVLVDTTNATIYASGEGQFKLLSFSDVLALNEESRFSARKSNIVDVNLFSLISPISSLDRTLQSIARDEQYAYLLDRSKIFGILYNGEGHLKIDVSAEGNISQLPKYIGSNKAENSGISSTLYSSSSDQGADLAINLVVSGVGGCSAYGAILVDDTGREFPLDQGANQLTIRSGSTFTVKRESNEVCYVVFSEIALTH